MEGYSHSVHILLMRLAAAVFLSAFFLLGLPLLASAAEPAVVINEVMWDGDEYLEFYNSTGGVISLEGWTLIRQKNDGEPEKTITTFDEEAYIAAGGYFLIVRKEEAVTVPADLVTSSLILVNSGELVVLRDAAGQLIDQANQFDAWFAGKDTTVGVSMERTDAAAAGTAVGGWHTSTGALGGRFGTPGAANSEPKVNEPPEAVLGGAAAGATGEELLFTAEDSADPDGDKLTYTWTFGDGQTAAGFTAAHSYTAAGTYTVQVTVTDASGLTAEAAREVEITVPVYSAALVINEMLPNPVGSDTAAEFIELYNSGAAAVDLAGWQLDDADGGSAPYTFGTGVQVPAGGYRVFLRSQTGLALNNTGDTVRLFDPSGESKASAVYSGGAEGQSYNRTSDGYAWSETVTPGAANEITAAAADEEEDEEDAAADSTEGTTSGSVAGSQAIVVPLAKVRDMEPGTTVTVTGVVSVPPGVLGKYIMYVAGSGIQVYLSREAWPQFKLGDTVQLTGELSSIRGEARIKLAGIGDVQLQRAGDPPEPHAVKTGEVDEALEGWLVTIQGAVSETSGDTFYVDDGSGAVKVSITESSGIAKPAMKKGAAVTITGVVSETTSGYRILPRFQEDVRLGRVAGLKSFPATGMRQGYSRQAGLLFARQAGLLVALACAALMLLSARRAREPLVT
ncbi:MAG: hypothetical protein COT71_00730 [Candidatus Andersenbacteria bacterium CG10_big_fil_rev_8_21_14_0_10_54_11]|uniref:PKD domain-containing protein n=1 Tax=Candidatus Andersenbacteria bacterium CG10_big_fil_rev_8_21_14_0_10_54_11 TaxID=1974485 RepID=A0A2M6X006_9BACT|nr:MAG: hypothetical protein COT71_00730 [Candidatus Andersenbacteria bacterium CG10_big_fil_rev_8_21_14_0_10_54_11]